MNEGKTSVGSQATPRIGSVLETALYVADLDRSVTFYQRVLGLPLASEPLDRMCALSITANQGLLLFSSTAPSSACPAPRPFAFTEGRAPDTGRSERGCIGTHRTVRPER